MPRPNIKDVKVSTTDSFANVQMRLGVATNSAGQGLNQLSGGSYLFNPITRLRILLDFMYRGSWIIRRAVDTIADDMTREGVDFESSLDPDVHEQLHAMMVDLQIWDKINLTLKWGRLYGGCLAFLMIDGQDPSTPLDIEKVGKGQFKGLFVLDRWMVQPSLQDPITDFGPNLGLPKYYFVNTDANGIPMLTIHYTRVMRITGDPLPYYQKQSENMWDASVLESIYDRLVAFDSVTMGAAQLVFKAHLRTLKLPNFRELIAEGGQDLEAVTAMINMIKAYQSFEGLTVIDDKDTLEYNTYSFSGLSDIMGRFEEQISGAVKTPLVKLFGQSPGGFSTGDTDILNYYDMCKSEQMSQLKPGLTVLFPVMHRSLTGKSVPDGFKWKFNPLWQLDDKEKGDLAKGDSDDVLAVHGAGLISDRTALVELRERGRVTGRWQSISDEDIDDADDELAPKPDLSAFGPAGPDDKGGDGVEPDANREGLPGTKGAPAAKKTPIQAPKDGSIPVAKPGKGE